MKSKPLTQNEADLIGNNLPLKYKELFIFGLNTGLRIGETLQLYKEHITEQDGSLSRYIRVPKRITKRKTSARAIIINKTAKEILMNILNRQGSKLFNVTRSCYHRELKAAAIKAGISPDRISTHSTRKTFATKIYNLSNKDIALTAKALGHTSILNTILYLDTEGDKLNQLIVNL